MDKGIGHSWGYRGGISSWIKSSVIKKIGDDVKAYVWEAERWARRERRVLAYLLARGEQRVLKYLLVYLLVGSGD